MTSKQRAYLKSLAMKLQPCINIGKEGLTPGVTESAIEALEAHELIKINLLKNCAEDFKETANTLADRTHSEVVQIIGRKIVLFKVAKKEENRKIVLPKSKKAGNEGI